MTIDPTQLSCLVLATDQQQHQHISTWLGASGLVGSVTAVYDDDALCQQLSNSPPHMCIVVINHRQQTLPQCVWQQGNTKILVLTKSRKIGKYQYLLEKGASDLASLKKPLAAQHAIRRLIDDCVNTLQKHFFEIRSSHLQQEVTTLKQVLDSRDTSRKNNTSTLIDASLFVNRSSLQPSNEDIPVVGKTERRPALSNKESRQLIDAATGLPARFSAIEQFQRELNALEAASIRQARTSSQKNPGRCTVMLLQLVGVSNGEDQSSVNQNLQDLILCRAANVLQSQLRHGRLLGRSDQQSLLLLIRQQSSLTSRAAANWVRDQLGSLNGLIDPARNVQIFTLTLEPGNSPAAEDLVCRLEAHRRARQKNALRSSASSPELVP